LSEFNIYALACKFFIANKALSLREYFIKQHPLEVILSYSFIKKSSSIVPNLSKTSLRFFSDASLGIEPIKSLWFISGSIPSRSGSPSAQRI